MTGTSPLPLVGAGRETARGARGSRVADRVPGRIIGGALTLFGTSSPRSGCASTDGVGAVETGLSILGGRFRGRVGHSSELRSTEGTPFVSPDQGVHIILSSSRRPSHVLCGCARSTASPRSKADG